MNNLPHSDEHERAIICNVLLDGAPALSRAFDAKISVESYYNVTYRKIWKSILDLHGRGKPLETSVLAEEMKAGGKLEEIGGYGALVEATDGNPSVATYAYSLEKVRELHMLRKLVGIADETKERALAYTGNIEDFVTKVSDALALKSATEKVKTLEDVVDEVAASCMRIINGEQSEEDVGLRFPWLDWNNTLGPAQGGELIIVAARPGVGKSSNARQIAWNWANEYGDILYFSHEMTQRSVVAALAQMVSGVSYRSLKRGELAKHHAQKFMDALTMIRGQKRLHIFDRDSTYAQVVSRIQALKQTRKIKGIFVDYLQLEDPQQERGETRDIAIGRMSKGYKNIANALDIPVVALSQIGRTVERDSRTPRLSDLRECLCVKRTMVFTSHGILANMDSHISTVSLDSFGGVLTTESRHAPRASAPKLVVVKTESGREVCCTPNHLIKTDRGFIKASELMNDDYAVASVASLPPLRNSDRIEAARWIGWMLGNGSSMGNSSPSFICSCSSLADYFCRETERLFNLTPKPHKHWSKAVWQFDITAGPVRTSAGNPCKDWMKQNDLWNKRAPQKVIPAWFCETADNESVAELLGGLFDTDGSVMSSPRPKVQFSTTSKHMAWQVLWGLMRLNIYGHIDDGYMNKKATTPCYKVSVCGLEQIASFRSQIKLTGRKGEKLMSLDLVPRREPTGGSRLGRWVGRLLKKWMAENNIHADTLGYRPQGKRISQDRLFKVCVKLEELGCPLPSLHYFLNKEIYWDAVRSVTEIEGGPVFDRVVPEHHNFVANGVVVHNSGNIEQDADRVIFLHAPAENPRTGVAQDLNDGQLQHIYVEAIQAKGRSDGQHTVPMIFHRPTTTFHNYTA